MAPEKQKNWTLDDESFFLGEEDYEKALKAAEKTGSSAKSQGFLAMLVNLL